MPAKALGWPEPRLMWAAAQSQAADDPIPPRSRWRQVDLRATNFATGERRVTAEGRPKDMEHGGFTALLYAAREGCVACARELVRSKADLNLADPDGVTPLILALMKHPLGRGPIPHRGRRRREPVGTSTVGRPSTPRST